MPKTEMCFIRDFCFDYHDAHIKEYMKNAFSESGPMKWNLEMINCTLIESKDKQNIKMF